MPLVREYSRNLGQHSILARKGTFFESALPSPPIQSLFLVFCIKIKLYIIFAKGTVFESWMQYRSRICPDKVLWCHSLTNHIWWSKYNHTMKSGEFIKYNKIYFSSKIVQKNGAVRLFLRLFLFFNKALSEVKASGGYPSNVHTFQSPSNWPTMKRNCIKL